MPKIGKSENNIIIQTINTKKLNHKDRSANLTFSLVINEMPKSTIKFVDLR